LSHLVPTIEHMFGRLKRSVAELEQAVQELDPESLEPRFAVDLVKVFSKAEKLACAGKALAARRVAQGGGWQGEGDRSAAHFLARTTGDSVSASVTVIETACRMSELSSAEEAFRSGRLTAAQAAEIASAAAVAPRAEKALLEVAEGEGIERLRQVCREVVARQCKDEQERAERLYRSRYLRTWTDPEGSFRMDARLTPEAGAEVRSVLEVLREEQFQRARRQGRKEPYQALEADALVEMARAARAGSGRVGPKAVVNLTVDHRALVRGHAHAGEACEVAGVGPISVAAARGLLADSFLKLILTKGGKIKEVAHLGRTIPARLRTSLEQSYPECVVKGCRESRGLEIDHVVSLAEGGATSLDNLVRICSHHHRLKTYRGFRLKRVRDKWVLAPPQDAPARTSPH
jgi:hypothetical protein